MFRIPMRIHWKGGTSMGGAVSLLRRSARVIEAYINSWEYGGWTVIYFWNGLDLFSKGTLLILALMFGQEMATLCGRVTRFHGAGRESRKFVAVGGMALSERRMSDLIELAARLRRSHVASVVGAGVSAFAGGPEIFSHSEVNEIAERAMERVRGRVSAELRVGLNTLATIAVTAPLIGLWGTVIGILNSFVSTSGSKSAYMAYVANHLAIALVMAGAGMVVAIGAAWIRNYLRGRADGFETEMRNAELETTTYLRGHWEWRKTNVPLDCEVETLFEIKNRRDMKKWEVAFSRQGLLLGAIVFCELYIAVTIAWSGWYWHRWEERYEANLKHWVQVGGYEAVSPDGRYLAIAPARYVVQEEQSPCEWKSFVALRIQPNDRPKRRVRYDCANPDTELEKDEVLVSSDCSTPSITWRTNEELVVRCEGCTSHSFWQVKRDLDGRRITILDSEGNRLRPKMVNWAQECKSK
jgi:biopolymer transport protein ExbB/TolQ